jgi:hypothetical protein
VGRTLLLFADLGEAAFGSMLVGGPECSCLGDRCYRGWGTAEAVHGAGVSAISCFADCSVFLRLAVNLGFCAEAIKDSLTQFKPWATFFF